MHPQYWFKSILNIKSSSIIKHHQVSSSVLNIQLSNKSVINWYQKYSPIYEVNRMDGTRPPSKQTKLLFIQSINWCNSPEIAEIGISNWKAVSHLVIVSHVTTWHVAGTWHVTRSSCANCENVLVLSAEYNGSIVTDSGVQMCANTHPICVWHRRWQNIDFLFQFQCFVIFEN